jgi:Fe-S oxidoreductase
MLDLAKVYLEDTLATLKPHVDAGIPMIVLEPSCGSVFKDELGELLPSRNEAKNLSAQTFTLSEFLDAHVDPSKLPKLRRKAIVQIHCHHHSIMRFDAEERVMKNMGLDFEVLKSGCCGMAGSFGFEKDKLDVSQACGERVLLPRVRDADASTLILADGFSCKTQIAQNGERRGVHLAEALALALEHGENGPAAAPFVESSYVARGRREIRRSITIAATFLILLFLALVAIAASFVLPAGL